MSTNITAKIVVGLPYEKFGGDSWEHLEEELGLSRISPYYDADVKDCIFGIEIVRTAEYMAEELSSNFQKDLKTAEHLFKKATGLEGLPYLGANVD